MPIKYCTLQKRISSQPAAAAGTTKKTPVSPRPSTAATPVQAPVPSACHLVIANSRPATAIGGGQSPSPLTSARNTYHWG
jgi:hypothetical protein